MLHAVQAMELGTFATENYCKNKPMVSFDLYASIVIHILCLQRL